MDFKKTISARSAFESDIDVDATTLRLTAVLPDAKFVPGRTVIVLDEIHECARARFSIKSFIEDGRYDVIATGSLLGIRGYNRKDRDIPVGSLVDGFYIEGDGPESVVAGDHGRMPVLHPSVEEVSPALGKDLHERIDRIPCALTESFGSFAAVGYPHIADADVAWMLHRILV